MHVPTGEKIAQSINWAVLGTAAGKKTEKAFKAALAAQTFGIAEINNYLQTGLTQIDFFEELFDEYARYFFHTKHDRHVQAFLHCYRILERISYALPIAYASKTSDYKGTFANFKNFLTSPKDGELAFLNSFIQSILPQTSLDSQVRLDISTNSIPNRAAHFQSLANSIKQNKIVSQVANSYIEIKYSSLLGILITLRNRYFHFMSGIPDNLTGKNLPDPDEFFESINPAFINWITYIYFRVIEARI